MKIRFHYGEKGKQNRRPKPPIRNPPEEWDYWCSLNSATLLPVPSRAAVEKKRT